MIKHFVHSHPCISLPVKYDSSVYLVVCFQKGNARVDQGAVGSEGAEGVTDVIQHFLELSDHVTADSAQAPPHVQAIGTAINQDILQVSKINFS